jgi:hypothetical protein
MTNTLNDHLERPLMLNDIAANAQRLSVSLPPDNWDVEVPRRLLVRQASGVFDLVSYSLVDDEQDDGLTVDV